MEALIKGSYGILEIITSIMIELSGNKTKHNNLTDKMLIFVTTANQRGNMS